MTEHSEEQDPTPPLRRRRHGRFGLSMLTSLTFAGLIAVIVGMSLSGGTIAAPDVIRSAIESSVNRRFADGHVSLGRVEFGVGRNGIPRVILKNLRIDDSTGGAVIAMNELRASLSPPALLRGRLALSRLVLSGAQITVRRTRDGSFTFAKGDAAAKNFAAIFADVEHRLSASPFADMQEIAATGVVISLEDARSGRIWQATNAQLIVRRVSSGLAVTVASDVFNGTDNLAELQLSLSLNSTTRQSTVGVRVRNMPAADVALQAPALAWLGVLDAPLSGAVRADFGADGKLSGLDGTLDIAAGALKPNASATPVAFESARAYFSFDPAKQRIDFSDIAVVSQQGRLAATGRTYLSELQGGWPQAYLGQFAVSEASYAGGSIFAGPVTLKDLRADLRLRLDPFSVDLAQVVVDNQGTPVRATGRIEARNDGWSISVDGRTDRISAKRVFEFWPVIASPKTRDWLIENHTKGTLTDVAAAVRWHSGEKPDNTLSFVFRDGATHFLGSLPPIDGGQGRGAIFDKRLTLLLNHGGVTATTGGRVAADGSVMTIPDVDEEPATGNFHIAAAGALTAMLSIMNNEPFRIMDHAKQPVDIAKARARLTADVETPLKKGIVPEDVHYHVQGTASSVKSEKVVHDRLFTADKLQVEVDPTLLRVSGAARLDGVPLNGTWRQPLGPDAAGKGSTVTGRTTISRQAIDAFNLPLTPEMVKGEALADFTLDLSPGEPPHLTLESNLRGLALTIDPLAWSKGASVSGELTVAATLGAVPEVTVLTLAAAGMDLSGRVLLQEGGALKEAVFDKVKVGGWLDAAAKLTPSARGGSPNMELTGGTFDLRRFDLGSGSGGSRDRPVRIALDKVIVSDGITLAPFVGQMDAGSAGLSGQFDARVNGRSPVRTTLAPANAGTAIRVQSDDAGATIGDAGLTPNARGGTLDLVLTPVKGGGGIYDGQFLIENMRLQNAPAMASLLDAISVVGLLSQLSGPGIRFDTIDGKFRLDSHRLTLRQAAAVGPSLGISADGIYDIASTQIDMRGVISPVYFLNGIGSILTRKGEGLFGFNFSMTGKTDNPTVGVNPLSIFTPGMFRQLFRRPIPEE